MSFLKEILYLVAIVVIFAGCADNSTNPAANNDIVMPLKVGNQWVYRHYFIDTSGVFKKEDEFFNTIEVWGTDVFKNERWAMLSDTSDGSAFFYYLNRPDGLWWRDQNGYVEHIKYPAQKGEIYHSQFLHSQNEDSLYSISGSLEVIAKDTLITTPAGTFACYAYLDVIPDTHRFSKVYYYSPGIGLVKEIVTSRFDKENWGSELIKYSFK